MGAIFLNTLKERLLSTLLWEKKTRRQNKRMLIIIDPLKIPNIIAIILSHSKCRSLLTIKAIPLVIKKKIKSVKKKIIKKDIVLRTLMLKENGSLSKSSAKKKE